MYLIQKLQEHGLMWFVRRAVSELVKPTTSLGKYFRPFSSLIYVTISKPINYFSSFRFTAKKSKSSLYFFYDLDIEPITYDFVWALCIANAKREELGLTSLHVVFVPGKVQGLRKESSDYERAVSSDARHWRIYSILIPALKLLPCKFGITFCTSREDARFIRQKQAKFVYPDKYNVTFPIPYAPEQAMQYYQNMLPLRADNQALSYVSEWLNQHAPHKKTIVITLRQYAFAPDRNSNMNAWAKFAKTLDSNEFFVVFVPDMDQALNEQPKGLSEFHFFTPACWNLNLRAALYESAYLNLGVNTGPMALCWLNARCNYITFKAFSTTVPQASMEVMIDRGFIPSENPKFATPFQKWVWQEDDFEIILEEFKWMCDSLEKRI